MNIHIIAVIWLADGYGHGLQALSAAFAVTVAAWLLWWFFGYVVSEAEDGARRGDVSSRGRLIFGAVDASRAEIKHKEKILSPLLQPKTTSARRFLTDSEGRTPTDEKGAPLARGEHFSSSQFLGAAAYQIGRAHV